MQPSDSKFRTLIDLLERNMSNYGDKPAYREKEFGIWQSWTWFDAANEIESLALGLIKLGAKEGDKIAVAGRNRPALYWSILAIQSVGSIPVPVYQEAVADEMAYVLAHSGARFAIAGDQEQVDKILEQQEQLPELESLVYLDPKGLRRYDKDKLHSFKQLQIDGRADEVALKPELKRRREAVGGATPCVILYTSGTTGRPKGVVLTHANIVAASKASCEFDTLTSEDTVLAYLPMAWVGDFIFSIGQACWTGFCVHCPESADTMMADLREIGPTYFFAPPRIFEMLLTRVNIRMEDASRPKRWLFNYFMKHARSVGPTMMSGGNIGFRAKLLYALGDTVIYGPLRNAMGFSKVRVGYTAGEAIGPEIFTFFRSIKLNLKQLYGQTEASVFITQQPDDQVSSETVGVPTPGVEVRIADNGEVLYRSEGSFVEYYNNPDATASTKDPEGWVATGDAGFFDQATGHLKIIDRAKDVGKTGRGDLFAPKYVENKLKFYPNILEAVVFGNGKDTCVAFINIDVSAVGNWAERHNITYSSYQELAGRPEVYDMIAGHIEETNADLAQDSNLAGCQISRFLILHKELDADDGELTRTRKVRRRIIEDKYAALIDALYDGKDSVLAETEVTYEDGRKASVSATLNIRDVSSPGLKAAA